MPYFWSLYYHLVFITQTQKKLNDCDDRMCFIPKTAHVIGAGKKVHMWAIY